MSLIFFLDEDGSTRVSLDIESSIIVNMPSSISKTSNMSGVSSSDEVIEGNITIDVVGRVSYSKTPSQQDNLTPKEFKDALQACRRNRRKFTLYSKETHQQLVDSYPDCVLANAQVEVGKYTDTIDVQLTFEQVFVSDAATVTTIQAIPSEAAKPTVGGSTSSSQTTSTQATPEEATSLAYAAVNGLGSTFTTPTVTTP